MAMFDDVKIQILNTRFNTDDTVRIEYSGNDSQRQFNFNGYFNDIPQDVFFENQSMEDMRELVKSKLKGELNEEEEQA